MKKISLLIICSILHLTAVFAQSNSVRVSLTVAAPYSTKLSDYRPANPRNPGKMIVRVQNLTRTEQRIYLRGDIKGENNGVRIYTSPDYVPPVAIVLNPLETRQLFSHEIMDLYDPNRLTYIGANQNEIRNSDRVPEGRYSICIRAYNHTPGSTNIPLSPEDPAGCTTLYLKNTEPPILIQPMEEASIKNTDIQNVIFSWTVPAGTPIGTQYRLKIVEMFDPKRNPNDAFLSGTNPPFFEKDLISPVYVYGPADLPLVPGRRYAWAVTALDPDLQTSYQNQGRSEVRSFTYGGQNTAISSPVLTRETVTKDKPKKGKNPAAIQLPKTVFTADLEIRNLIRNSFRGKLTWAFRKSEAGKVMEPVVITTQVTVSPQPAPTTGKEVNSAFKPIESVGIERSIHQPVAQAVASPVVQTQPSASSYLTMGGGSSQINFNSSLIPQLTQINILQSEREKHQARIIALSDETRRPLAHTKISLYIRKAGKNSSEIHNTYFNQPNNKNFPEEIMIGQTTTNAEGDFNLEYNDQLPSGYEAFLKIDNPYFEFADYQIPLRPQNGIYDLGELLGLAKTYRLKAIITGAEGTTLDAVKIKMERPKGFYANPSNQNLLHEVMRDSLNGLSMETVAIGETGAYWPRLFFSNGYTDAYQLIIEGEEVNKTVYNINFFEKSSSGLKYSDNDYVPTLTKTFVPDIPLPTLEGTVLTRQGEIPVSGASVIVRRKGSNAGNVSTTSNGMMLISLDLNSRSGTTDSMGRFKIENIPAIQEAYEVVIKYKGRQTIHDQDQYLSMRGYKGIIPDPIYINAELITVIGKVIDTGGEPLADAALSWKSGGKIFYSDEDGSFIGSQVEGKHTLISRKPGFKDTEYTVELKLPAKSTSSSGSLSGTQMVSNWTTNVTRSLENFKGTGLVNTSPVSPKPSGKTTTSGTHLAVLKPTGKALNQTISISPAAKFYEVFSDGISSETISSDHVIVMGNFYVKVTVKDNQTKQPIVNAKVKSAESTRSFVTGQQGTALVEDVPGGNASIVVSGPPDSFYATLKAELTVDPSKDTVHVEVLLKAGAQVKGRVLENGNPLAQAEITVEGLEHIHTETDQNGNYTLAGVPAGEYTLIASKEGLLSDSKTQEFTANQSYTLDFKLTDPGFNATNLLGFKLVLHKSRPGPGPNEFIISGELKDIPDNPVFKLAEAPGYRFKFTEKTIVKSGNIIYPKGNELVTDVSELRLKVFDFLAVNLKNSSGLRIRSMAGSNHTKGEIVGDGVIDIGKTFSALQGIQMPELNLKSQNNQPLAPITSNGEFSIASLGIAGSTAGWKLYGVTLTPDLSASSIDKNGFNFKGKLKIEGVPLLNTQELQLSKLTINKRGEIKDAAINLNPAPTLTLVNWKLKLSEVRINQYGLRLSGDLDVPIPSSANAKIGVRELGISGNSLAGGSFLIPEAGIDIFGIVKFKTNAGRDFAFQKIAGANHYRFVGAGTISLPKWINQRVELDNFSIATNGDFSVIAKTDIEVDFAGMAKLGITRFGFSSPTSAITVGGKFRLNIPMFGAGAEGTLHFQKGRAPRMDELGINFNLMTAIALEAKLKFTDTEFRGKGGLKLAGIPGVGLEFWYMKQQGGPRVGAQFLANMVIPIGLVKLDRLTGGFDFDIARSMYSINAGGRITVAPDPYGVVSLDEVRVAVTAAPGGPVFEGGAAVKVMDAWALGRATMKLDFNKKQFFIDGKFGAGFNLIKGVSVESHSGVHLQLYTGEGSNYWFMAGYSRTRILSIFDTGVTIAAGWNVPKSTHESLQGVPDYVLTNGRLYGGYFGTHSNINFNPPPLGFKDLATLSVWYKNTGACEVFANFKSNAYGFRIASDWGAGGSVRVFGLGTIASARVTLGGSVEGYYNNNSWGARGQLQGEMRGHLGCDGGCNFITWGGCFNACVLGCRVCPIPCGFKICAKGNAQASYDSQNGFHLSFSISD